jgi:arabinofuranan 3-O-arabinosyltransferase
MARQAAIVSAGPPGAGPGAGGRDSGQDRTRWLTVQAACYLGLAALPFVTSPGLIIGDSKLDMAVNPLGYLGRALSVWDPAQFGQLQNQAVGYLFPMGPFFAVGRLAAVPAWVIQRLWIAAILIAAFAGTVRLAKRIGIGTPWTQAVAGLAYALSPAALTTMGEYSGEYLPEAMLPWILIPLVDAARGGRRWRAAARSAAAVALCSGINAGSTVAVLVPAFVCILTLRSAVPRWRILAWWMPAVLLASCWWAIPLVLLGKYGVSFVPYTESAAATTSVTSLLNTFRGTENWISYLLVNGKPWWHLGFLIATTQLPVLLTGLTAALGLAGLIRRELPERRFLLWCTLAGLIIISAGYVSSLGNPLVAPLYAIINGPASAFRNLWKFDPAVRLPVALGLAQLLATVRAPRLRAAAFIAAGVGIVGLAVPAYADGLATPGAFQAIPPYWVSAANWLTAHAGHQAVLLEPGGPFGQYVWGSPMDDVLQPLTSVDFAERDLSAVGSPGNSRLLATIDQRLAAGTGSPGLAQLIARMGVKYVVVRNDLERAVLEGTWPARVHQALAASPGLTEVASFGPPVSGDGPGDAVTNFDAPYPAVEIYQVAGAWPVATVQPDAGTLRVDGAPEAMLTLADEGLLGRRPVLVGDDGAGLPATSVLTDSLRRRTRNFGELRKSYSPTLTAAQPASTFWAIDDYTQPTWNKYLTVARYVGIKDVTASSSDSDIGALISQWGSGLQPFSAIDGNIWTSWESGSWTGSVGQWIQLDFDSPVDPRTIGVAFDVNSALGPPVTRVSVTTAAGQLTDRVAVTSSPQPLRVPAGASNWLRIKVTGLTLNPVPPIGAQVGIAEISVPGVRASRTIEAPPVSGAGPAAVVLAKAEPQPSGCMLTSLRWVCSPALVRTTEEQFGFDHSFTEPAAGRAQLSGRAVLTDSSLADHYVRLSGQEPAVTGSSIYTGDPQDQPLSAFDGNPATSWVSGIGDKRPKLTISWGHPRTVSQVTIQRPPGALGRLQVLVTGSGGRTRGGPVGDDGVLRFAPLRTTSLTFRFTPSQAPLQVSDVSISGLLPVGTPSGTFQLPCGLGPLIELNGRQVRTQVSGSFTALLTGAPLRFTACAPVTLAAGANRVIEPDTDAFSVQDVVFDRTGAGGLSAARPAVPAAAAVVSWSSSARTLRVTAAARSYLVVNENFNTGWQATIGGRPLAAVRLDGWKQAWLLPAGTRGVVRLTYRPEVFNRAGIIGGLAVMVLIMLAAAWPSGRRGNRAPGAPVASVDPPARPGTRPSGRLRRGLAPGAVLGGLVVTGFWLGGYPGAVILPAATCLFLLATGYRGSPEGMVPAQSRRFWLWILRRRLVVGLVLLASASYAVGEHQYLTGHYGWLVSAMGNAIPQIVGLIVIGRLMAALIIP